MASYPTWAMVVTVTLIRVLMVIGLLFGAMPVLLFPGFADRGSAGVVGRAALFLFPVMVAVHFLGFVKLYEGLLVLTLLGLVLAWRFYFALDGAARESTLNRLGLWALHGIDRLTGRGRRRLLTGLDELSLPRPRVTWAEGGALLAIFGVAAWMLFDGAYRHAAPAFSDAPVTLKWMKTFGIGQLYADGVYPQGMYAFLSLVRKLSAQNDFLVMSVIGPLVGLGLVGGLAAFLRWCTGSTVAAGMGALLYGTLPTLLPAEYARHVGYNSQEFGVLFALPAAWFAFQYLKGGHPWHGLVAGASVGIAAFVHPVAAVICIALVGGAGVAAMALRAFSWRRIFTLLGLGAAAGIVAVLPPVIGLTVLKLPWHGSSTEFLTESTTAPLFVPSTPVLAVVGVGMLAPLLLRRVRQPEVWLAWCVAWAGIACWLLPHLARGGALNTLAFRSGEAGAMGIAIAGGLAALALERHLPGAPGSPLGKAALLCTAAAVAWFLWPPRAPEPPRVSTDEKIMQALRVDRELVRGDWMLVMDNMGYSLALENGQHRLPVDFLASIRLTPKRACWEEKGLISKMVPHVAIFLDKAEAEYPALKAWVDEHKGTAPLSQVFASPTLEVWMLTYKLDPQEQFDAVWGIRNMSLCSDSHAE